MVASGAAAPGEGFSVRDLTMAAASGHLVAVAPGIGASFVQNGATSGVLFVVVFAHARLNGVVDVSSSVRSGSLGVGLR